MSFTVLKSSAEESSRLYHLIWFDMKRQQACRIRIQNRYLPDSFFGKSDIHIPTVGYISNNFVVTEIYTFALFSIQVKTI